jgi:hypothetical protein
MFSFGGDMNLFEGRVRNEANQTLFRLKGKWDEKLVISESSDTKKFKKSVGKLSIVFLMFWSSYVHCFVFVFQTPDVVSAAATEWVTEAHQRCVDIAKADIPEPASPYDDHILWLPCGEIYEQRLRYVVGFWCPGYVCVFFC